MDSSPHTVPDTGDRLVAGLEAIIDAATGVLAAQSLEETLQGMADALAPIVPYTSLAVFEVVWAERVLVPLLATGRYVPETLASRPTLDNSITGSAVLRAEVVYLAPGDPLLRKHVMPGTPQSDDDAILVAPLVVADHVVGTLNVWREDQPAWFQPEESLLLRRFASLAAMAYANSAQREQLRIQALTDELTGLFNRRHFEHCLSRALREERDRRGPTSVVYFDVDAFKGINDAFGHAAGDQVLREFSEVLRAESRRDDIPCRTGGEEFCLVLPRTTSEEAKQVADRVVAAVRGARLGPRRNLTVSAGVATSPESQDDRDHLVRDADAHLMQAKREGRDRVVLSEPGRVGELGRLREPGRA
jgi:diguanylate cyclase (GGDEF)-like protein